LPFLGVALSRSGMRDIPSIEQLSFGTQKLLLTAIYSGWTKKALTEAAKALGTTKMSITRYFDELEALGLMLVKSEGKMRHFLWENSRRALWEATSPFLRNPVAQQYRLGEPIDIAFGKLGGMSALCYYSMLADIPYTIYAISKDAAKALEPNKLLLIPENECPGMVVQVMQYNLAHHDTAAIDPLTAILSLTDAERSDPRVEVAIEAVLGDCLHD